MGDTPSLQEAMLAGGAWPEGWYIYEDGHVRGPYTAAEAFNKPTDPVQGKPPLVSRTGFSQWYPLRDLAEIFVAGAGAAIEVAVPTPKVIAKKIRAQAPVVAGSSTPVVAASPSPVVAPPSSPVVAAPSPAAHVVAVAVPATPVIIKPAAPATSVTVKPAAPNPTLSVHAEAMPAYKRPSSVSPPVSMAPSRPVASAASKLSTKRAVVQEYFLAQPRLRLGKLRNPWLSAFVALPLSVGVYWSLWFAATTQEMRFHSQIAGHWEKASPFPALLAMIPLLHMYMIYRLAKQLVAMEEQNKYRYTSPILAVSLAILPPLAMAYLQHALNRHWLLHAKHAGGT